MFFIFNCDGILVNVGKDFDLDDVDALEDALEELFEAEDAELDGMLFSEDLFKDLF